MYIQQKVLATKSSHIKVPSQVYLIEDLVFKQQQTSWIIHSKTLLLSSASTKVCFYKSSYVRDVPIKTYTRPSFLLKHLTPPHTHTHTNTHTHTHTHTHNHTHLLPLPLARGVIYGWSLFKYLNPFWNGLNFLDIVRNKTQVIPHKSMLIVKQLINCCANL